MKDSLGHILYVGKSKNLKNRVQSYFQNSKAHTPKIKKLVNHLKDFELIPTDTEFEAFMLECQLIQQLKPLYNKKMKSPLSYTYIVIRKHDGLRRMEITDRPDENDGNLYFGPFTSRNTVEKAVQGLKETFRIGCSGSSARNTACLNYSLGLCMGMCLGGEALEQYNQVMNRIITLLQGSDRSIPEEMKRRMSDASGRFDFEAAAKYRDCIDAVTSLLNKEKVIAFAEADTNIAIIEYLNGSTLKLFLIKRNAILLSEKYAIEDVETEQLIAQIKTAILDCFKTQDIPLSPEVIRYEIDAAQIIYSYLSSGSSKSVVIPDHWLEPANRSAIDGALKQLLSG